MPKFALIDGNAFYCSVEKIFRPDLATAPVVVLSNNDGCIVSLTTEAKALGFKRGMPFFKIERELSAAGVAVFSSNMPLYERISADMMASIASCVPAIEVYSIDECFADIDGVWGLEPTALGHKIRNTVLKDVSIPTCVGIAGTKTLAKLANHLAKKFPVFRGVLDWDALGAERQRKALAWLDIDEVWGIGSAMSTRLKALGIEKALQFVEMDPIAVRKAFGVVGARLQKELSGIACLPFEPVTPRQQRVGRSRTFGRGVASIDALLSAAATHIDEACAFLRQDGSAAARVTLYYRTDPFRTDLPQHRVLQSVPLARPTQDTCLITGVVSELIRKTFRPGVYYRKLGIELDELTPYDPETDLQPESLFDEAGEIEARKKRLGLMRVMDSINGRFGRATITAAAAHLDDSWQMKQNFKSPFERLADREAKQLTLAF